MMEFTGEMLAAVNEMLMQSFNGVIRVFPAIPEKRHEWYDAVRRGHYLYECYDRYPEYEPWKDVRFDKLLAKGAFEISAEMREGKLQWIRVHSKAGGRVRIFSPYMTKKLPVWCDEEIIPAAMDEKDILTFETEKGKTYLIALNADAYMPKADCGQFPRKVLTHESFTKRTIYIGEEPDTAYHKAMDTVLRAWYLGELRQENRTMYKMDFGCVKDKEYWKAMPRQSTVGNKLQKFQSFVPVHEDTMAYTVKRGYGFTNAEGIRGVDRGGEDILRGDFLEGTEPAEFIIEAPRGQYEILVVSGDPEEEFVTILEGPGGYRAGGEIVKPGFWQCELIPMMHRKDGSMKLKISTVPGKKWKISLLVLDIHKGYGW